VAFLLLRRYRSKRLRGRYSEETGGPAELADDKKPVPELSATGGVKELAAAPSTDRPLSEANPAYHEIDSSPRQDVGPLELAASYSSTKAAPVAAVVGSSDHAGASIASGSTLHSPFDGGSAEVATSTLAEVVQPQPQPDYSAYPEVVQPGPDAAALQALQARHAELEREQQLIVRLQQIRSEQEQLEQQISEMGGRAGGSSSP